MKTLGPEIIFETSLRCASQNEHCCSLTGQSSGETAPHIGDEHLPAHSFGLVEKAFHQLRHTFDSHLASSVSLPIVHVVPGDADPHRPGTTTWTLHSLAIHGST